MESPFLAKDQALSLWSKSADSKTLDYQRTPNPREYQIELLQRQPLAYKTQYHRTTSSILCRTPHPNNKQNKNTNPINSRQDYTSLSLAHHREKKTTQLKSHSIRSLHKPLHQSFFKRKKESNLEAWVKETSNTIS